MGRELGLKRTNLMFSEDEVVMENDWTVIFGHLQQIWWYIVFFCLQFLLKGSSLTNSKIKRRQNKPTEGN